MGRPYTSYIMAVYMFVTPVYVYIFEMIFWHGSIGACDRLGKRIRCLSKILLSFEQGIRRRVFGV